LGLAEKGFVVSVVGLALVEEGEVEGEGWADGEGVVDVAFYADAWGEVGDEVLVGEGEGGLGEGDVGAGGGEVEAVGEG
jgi:hypothetical protein